MRQTKLQTVIYEATAETGAAMFKVVKVKLTAKDGKMTALITLSGVGYNYLYLGTKQQMQQQMRVHGLHPKEKVSTP